MASSINASTSGAGGVITTADNTGILNIQTANTTAVTVDASQNVGIGTASPAAKLTVASAEGLRTINDASYISFYNTAGSTRTGYLQMQAGGSANLAVEVNQPLTFSTNNTERMRIDATGSILVGATDYVGSGVTRAGIAMFNQGGTFGRINVGKTVSGAATAMQFNHNGTEIGAITYTNTGTSYVTTSDYRLKENVAPMTGALDKVAQLKPVTYTWKVDGSDGQGFIAHELAEVVPDCVTGEKDAVDAEGKPVYQGIDTSYLVATLTAAIQEQQTIINDLKARVTALEAK
jgi:hypothetical protein